MGYFPRNENVLKTFDQDIAKLETVYQNIVTPPDIQIQQASDSLLMKLDMDIARIKANKQAFRLENSAIGKLGKFIEPAIKPLGFDWKMGISLITGAAAKEIVVSTMGVLYQTNSFDGNEQTLVEKLRAETYAYGPKKGQPVFTPVVAFAFLIFVLIYFPCIAVVAAVKKETGGWKWAVFLALYTTSLAYLAALLVNQLGSLFFQ